MQTLTFTQKLLRQRRFLSSLIPLLALFVGLGISQSALAQGPAIYNAEAIFSQKPDGAPTATTQHYAGAGAFDPPYTGYTKLGSTNPASPTPTLGGTGTTYSIDPGNTTSLAFTGGSVVADPIVLRGGATVNPVGARMLYRSFLVGTSLSNQPTFSTLNLNNAGAFPGAPSGTLFNATTNINLLAGLLSGGIYVFEVKFEADYSNGSIQQATGNTYTANFTVTAPDVTPSGGTTRWISQSSTIWTMPTNWSNGVPNAMSDAVIPEKSQNQTINTVTPILDSQDSTLYNVRSLTLDGGTNSSRALLRIGATNSTSLGATLNVFGDLNVISSGILGATVGSPGASRKARNSTIALRGGNQKIKGTLNISDLIISGTGTKAIVNVINVNNTLVFDPGTVAGVLMETVTELSDGTVVFNTTGTPQLKLNGSIVSLLSPNTSETNNSYIRGVTIAQRTMFRSLTDRDGVAVSQIGLANTFGNIGLDIIPRVLDSDPLVTISRTVGDPLFSPVFPTRTPNPIKRQYGVSGDINSAPNVSDIIFHYLDSPDELNGNTDENQLTIFRATNNGPPYAPVGGTPSPANNTVRRNTITSINTITLGSRNNPLPVNLTAFDAKRVNDNALLTWQTASELNSRGYSVEVSNDGREYRVLTFVPSLAPNSVQVLNYSYSDTEKSKQGVRYYRIAQIDVDGKITYYAPRAVSFNGKASESAPVAYPNPFNGNDQLHLTFQSANAGKGKISITDMTGRMVRQQSIDVTTGTSDLTVEKLGDLKMGMYLVRLTLPSGQVQNLKVVKQ